MTEAEALDTIAKAAAQVGWTVAFRSDEHRTSNVFILGHHDAVKEVADAYGEKHGIRITAIGPQLQ